MKAVESDRESFSVPWPSVEMRIQVTRNTKMLEETVPAYLHRCVHVKIEFVLLKYSLKNPETDCIITAFFQYNLHQYDFKLITITTALIWNNYATDLVQSNRFVKLNRPFPNSHQPLFQSLSGRSLFWFILKEE